MCVFLGFLQKTNRPFLFGAFSLLHFRRRSGLECVGKGENSNKSLRPVEKCRKDVSVPGVLYNNCHDKLGMTESITEVPTKSLIKFLMANVFSPLNLN